MRKYEAIASRILETGTTSEAQLKRAELYIQLDRTEAMKPEPIVHHQKVEKTWIILSRTGDGPWGISHIFTDEGLAKKKYTSLSTKALGTNGYWEVDCREFEVCHS